MTDKALSLGAEFPDSSYEAWRETVEKALKGADFDKKLTNHTYDGLTIAPLYTKADGLAWAGQTGAASGAVQDVAWDIRSGFANPDLAAANAEILEDLARGVTSLTLKAGLSVERIEDLEALLHGVYTDLAPITLEAGSAGVAAAALLIGYFQEKGCDLAAQNAELNIDPIGTFARGQSKAAIADDVTRAAAIAQLGLSHAPKMKVLSANGEIYHAAGASEAQELGATIASGVAYLRAMADAGMSVDEAAGQISFTLATDTDFFLTIAKLRAARTLWANIIKASGGSDEAAAMHLHAKSAARMYSTRDPWVNMLRTTVAGFAAGVAGADVVTIDPFDSALGLPTKLGRRVARNVQVILQEESNIGRVADPAGGSWSIESLTQDLEDAAWAVFQEIEGEGGIVASLKAGKLQARIGATRDARGLNIAKRKDALTGVSEFPNLAEVPLQTRAVSPSKPKDRPSTPIGGVTVENANFGTLIDAARAGASIAELNAALVGTPDPVTPLQPHRLAEGFEALRDASDAHLKSSGTRPQIYLANLGSVAAFTARTTFATNFYEAGGVEALPHEGTADFKSSGAKIACLCSSDKVYAEEAEAAAKALKTAGATKVYLAGHPGKSKDAFESAGIDGFIYMGCNVLDTLKDIHTVLGVA